MNDLNGNEIEISEKQDIIVTSAAKQKIRRKLVFLLVIFLLTAFLVIGIYTRFFIRGSYEIQKALNNEISIGSGSYSGETDFGVFSGQGTFMFGTGDQYIGEWSNYQFNGYGELQNPEVGHYTGSFLDGHKHGTGTFTWVDGDSYSGEWQYDSIHGEGEYDFSNGDSLEGVFENGMFISGAYISENALEFIIKYKDGESTSAWIAFSDGTIYEGGFADSAISGYGEMRYANGDTYAGEYVSSKRCGDGTYTWSFGDVYVGKWTNDKMDGDGKYTFASDVVLSGHFKNNDFISGEYYSDVFIYQIESKNPIGITFEFENGLKYSGGFSSGSINGEGEMVFPSGDIYVGDFVNGNRHGNGTYTWCNGATYTGYWQNDEMHGAGTYKYVSNSDGYKLDGSFENGVPNGECKYYTSSTKYYVTTWQNGSCIKVTE